MKCKHCNLEFSSSSVSNFCCEGCETAYAVVTQNHKQNAGKYTIESYLTPDKKNLIFYIPDLRCASCLWLVKKALSQITQITQVEINLSDRCALVGFDSQTPDVNEISSALLRIGYHSFPAAERFNPNTNKEISRTRIKQLGIAGVAFVNVMLLSAGLYLSDGQNIDLALQRFFLWLSFAITAGSLWITARTLFIHSWYSLKFKKLHVDLPILFAMLVALTASVWNLAHGSTEVYFDSITGLLFFLLVGRTLHDNLLEHAQRLAKAAPSALPPRASEIQNGHVFQVSAGEVFPADGTIESGASDINESLLNGESLLVTKGIGQTVYAGTINVTGALKVKATHCQTETRLWQILKTIENAAQNKVIYQNVIDKILPWFVLVTLLLAICGFFIWQSTNVVFAVKVFVTVLIVCCPCALALALPLASTFYLQRAWKFGALIKSPDTLERLSKVDTIVIDKTRTITTGQITITNIVGSMPVDFSNRLAILTNASQHPVSNAVARYLSASKIEIACQTTEFPGGGASASFADNSKCFIGKFNWIKSQLDALNLEETKEKLAQLFESVDSPDCVYASDGINVCAFLIHDPLKTEAIEIFNTWKKQNIEVFIASGDTVKRVSSVANTLSIPTDHAFGDLAPEDKMKLVQNLQEQGKRVLFVGDGMNDAAAAQLAHVSVAVGGSIDIAVASSDIAFEGTNLFSIEHLRQFSKYSITTLHMLLATSFAYNLIAVALAFAGVLHPLVAALIMPLASVTVLFVCLYRKGDKLWKFSSLSCPYPSSSPASQQPSFGAPQTQGIGTI